MLIGAISHGPVCTGSVHAVCQSTVCNALECFLMTIGLEGQANAATALAAAAAFALGTGKHRLT